MSAWWWGLHRLTRDSVVAAFCLALGLLVSAGLVRLLGQELNWGGLALGVLIGWAIGVAIGRAAGWWFQ